MNKGLLCSFCNQFDNGLNKKYYQIIVEEIKIETIPYADFRCLQICEDCLNISEINKILKRDNRTFK